MISISTKISFMDRASGSVRENFTRYCSQSQKIRKKFSSCFCTLLGLRVSYYMIHIGDLYTLYMTMGLYSESVVKILSESGFS